MRRRSSFRPHWRDPVVAENADDVTRREAQTRYSRELLEETKVVWQPYYAKKFNDEDAREIIENMVSFLAILSEHRTGTRGDGSKSLKPTPRKR